MFGRTRWAHPGLAGVDTRQQERDGGALNAARSGIIAGGLIVPPVLLPNGSDRSSHRTGRARHRDVRNAILFEGRIRDFESESPVRRRGAPVRPGGSPCASRWISRCGHFSVDLAIARRMSSAASPAPRADVAVATRPIRATSQSSSSRSVADTLPWSTAGVSRPVVAHPHCTGSPRRTSMPTVLRSSARLPSGSDLAPVRRLLCGFPNVLSAGARISCNRS